MRRIERRYAYRYCGGVSVIVARLIGDTNNQTLGGAKSRFCRSIRRDDREFVSAPARAEICFAKPCTDGIGNAPDHSIAGRMTLAIVDPLKTIDVNQEKRSWRTVTHG